MKYEWRESNGQKYLYAEGENYYEMGLAKGHGLKDSIKFQIEQFKNQFYRAYHEPELNEIFENLRKGFYERIPEEYMDEIRGIRDGYMAEIGEDISLMDMAMHSFGIDINSNFIARGISLAKPADAPTGKTIMVDRGSHMEEVKVDECTNFGCINPDGSVTHGQNMDGNQDALPGSKFVYQKITGGLGVFCICVGGSIAWPFFKNEYGVAMTINFIAGNQIPEVVTPRAVLVKNAMKKKTAREAVACMTDNGRSPFSFNIMVSDNTTIYASQAIPQEARVTPVKQQIVQSNGYEYVDWQKYLLRPTYSRNRQLYAEKRLSDWFNRFGFVDDAALCDIIGDKPIINRPTTMYFLTRESFGIGNTLDNPIGKVPF